MTAVPPVDLPDVGPNQATMPDDCAAQSTPPRHATIPAGGRGPPPSSVAYGSPAQQKAIQFQVRPDSRAKRRAASFVSNSCDQPANLFRRR
jgi:hypothetical protein